MDLESVLGGKMDLKSDPDKVANWSDAETQLLIQIWSNDSVQLELSSSIRNQHVYQRIAALLREKGYPRTAEQCRQKIKKLKTAYWDFLSEKRRSDGTRKSCRYFSDLNAVLQSRSQASNLAMLDSPLGKAVEEDRTEEIPSGQDISAENFATADNSCLELNLTSQGPVGQEVIDQNSQLRSNENGVFSVDACIRRSLQSIDKNVIRLMENLFYHMKTVTERHARLEERWLDLEERRLKQEADIHSLRMQWEMERRQEERQQDLRIQTNLIQLLNRQHHVCQCRSQEPIQDSHHHHHPEHQQQQQQTEHSGHDVMPDVVARSDLHAPDASPTRQVHNVGVIFVSTAAEDGAQYSPSVLASMLRTGDFRVDNPAKVPRLEVVEASPPQLLAGTLPEPMT